MSREIDMDNLSEEDKMYLAQRGQLPESIASVEDQRKMLSSEPKDLDEVANTGTVNTANLSIEELEAILEKKRAEAASVDPRKLMKKSAKEAALAEDDGLEPPYDQYTKGALYAEVARRNEGRGETDLIEIEPPANKADFVSALDADDEAYETVEE